MPDLPIVDAHVHFWDGDAVPIEWTAQVPAIDRPFLPADYPAEVEALVFVEADVAPGRHLDEVAWVEGLAARDPRIAAIVAHAPLERGEAALPDLDRLAADPLVRGVRRLIQGRDAAALCADEGFGSAVRALAPRDLHFELCLTHDQLPPAAALCAACPGVRFVLDHIGKPPIRAGGLDPWRAEIDRLAALPNVVCKLSGVATEAHHDAWTPEALLPYMRHALGAFGAGRTLYGSDWPVARLAIDLGRWVDLVEEAMEDLSEAERREVFAGTARRVYRLGD